IKLIKPAGVPYLSDSALIRTGVEGISRKQSTIYISRVLEFTGKSREILFRNYRNGKSGIVNYTQQVSVILFMTGKFSWHRRLRIIELVCQARKVIIHNGDIGVSQLFRCRVLYQSRVQIHGLEKP